MSKTSLLLFSLFAATTLSAQETEKAIQTWQSLHPTTLLISADRYNSLSPEDKALIGTDIIVFQEKITLDQLEQYDAVKSTVSGSLVNAKEEDAGLIKDWLGINRDVMIVRASEFTAMDSAKQQECLNNPATILVLEGEYLTVKDIARYNY